MRYRLGRWRSQVPRHFRLREERNQALAVDPQHLTRERGAGENPPPYYHGHQAGSRTPSSALEKRARQIRSFFHVFTEVRKEIGDANLADWCYRELRISLDIVVMMAAEAPYRRSTESALRPSLLRPIRSKTRNSPPPLSQNERREKTKHLPGQKKRPNVRALSPRSGRNRRATMPSVKKLRTLKSGVSKSRAIQTNAARRLEPEPGSAKSCHMFPAPILLIS